MEKGKKENGERKRKKIGVSVRYAIAGKQFFDPSIHPLKEEKRNQEVEELRGALI